MSSARCNTSTPTRDGLVIELISQEVIDSFAIEDEILEHSSVLSSLALHLSFAADHRRAHVSDSLF